MQRDPLEPIRQARILSQRLTNGTRLPGSSEVVRALCGVQAQVPAAAALAIRARSTGVVAADVEHALAEERSIVRAWLMRGTLHIVAAQDLHWLLQLMGPRFAAGGRRRRLQLGLDDATSQAGVSALNDILASHGPMTRGQLLPYLRARGVRINPTGQALIHLVHLAGLLGVICLGPPRSGEDTYVRLDDWIPPERLAPGDAALGELARRYLTAYGPASTEDLMAWAGLPAGDCRRAIEIISPAVASRAGQRSLWTLGGKDRAATRARPVVRLLPAFDPYVLGYRSRELMIAPEFASRIQRGGGWLHPAVTVDGWIVGAWRLTRGERQMHAVIAPFEALDRRVLPGLEAEVADVGRFLGNPVQLSVADRRGAL